MRHELLIAGILISIVFYELTGLVPGGIIVGGYLALHLGEPLRVAYTLVVALGAYAVVELLGKVFILYGRRQFALCIGAAYLLHLGINAVGILPGQYTDILGILIPGIIAQEFSRQGVFKTLLAMICVVGAVALVSLLLQSL